MNKKDRDIFDDLIQSKLHDFEMDSLPENAWDKIAGHLPQTNHQPASRNLWRYWISAAAVSLFLMVGGIYFYDGTEAQPIVVDVIEQETEEIKSRMLEERKPDLAVTDSPSPVHELIIPKEKAETSLLAKKEEIADVIQELPIPDVDPEKKDVIEKVVEEVLETSVVDNTYMTQNPDNKKKRKRWSFGVGGAGISTTSTSLTDLPSPIASTSFVKPDYFLDEWSSLNAFTYGGDVVNQIKTDIDHKRPLSLGFSASYSLTDRWFLQLGLTYSFLKSDWKTGDVYKREMDQRLHFVGLPVSIAYKLKEWNNLMFYTSAGVKPEVNFAGRLKEIRSFEGIDLERHTDNLRMKEWYWSVNAGVGVSYPVFRYVNVFAEAGAGYYFDNGSSIETIHSEKPFKVNLGLGLRFGF